MLKAERIKKSVPIRTDLYLHRRKSFINNNPLRIYLLPDNIFFAQV